MERLKIVLINHWSSNLCYAKERATPAEVLSGKIPGAYDGRELCRVLKVDEILSANEPSHAGMNR